MITKVELELLIAETELKLLRLRKQLGSYSEPAEQQATEQQLTRVKAEIVEVQANPV